MFLCNNPKTRLALAIFSSICFSHLRFDWMVMPRYLQWSENRSGVYICVIKIVSYWGEP